MAVLSKSDQAQIEACVKKLEATTSGEVVVLYLRSSGGYAWVYYAWALLGLGLASIVAGCFSFREWGLSALQLIEWQLVGLSLGLLLSMIPGLRRCLVSARSRASKVHRSALTAFTSQGIFETRDRTGILICVADFEHQVEILADRGIHAKLGLPYWKTQAEAISAGVKKGQAVQALMASIEDMGKALTLHFPRKADDTNELPDSLRTD